MSRNSDWNVLIKGWIESWHSVPTKWKPHKGNKKWKKLNFTRVFCQRIRDMDLLEEVVEEKKGFIIVFREYLRPTEFSNTFESSWKKWQCCFRGNVGVKFKVWWIFCVVTVSVEVWVTVSVGVCLCLRYRVML